MHNIRGLLLHSCTAAIGLFLLLAIGFTSMAQERVGSIGGVVTDASGAAIPGVTVEATSSALLRPLTVTTDAAGAYLFASLPPGTYNLSISAKGFSTLKEQGLALAVGVRLTVNPRLEVGQVSESVVVSGEAVVIDTAQTTVATNVGAQIYDISPKGRSFDSLIAMAPGVRLEPKGGGYQVDGASGSENSYVIDGIEVTNIQTGVLDRQAQIPVEWVAETQVKSSGYDAQFGGAIGGVVNGVTKSGGNAFHGQVSLYLNSDVTDGNPRGIQRLNPNDDGIAEYFQPAKDGWRRLNPGFVLGGYIKKNRVWFLASSYPQFDKYDRTVKFLSTGNPVKSYTRNDRQDFTLLRLDVQPTNKLRANGAFYYTPYKVNGLLPSTQGTDPISSPWADLGSRSPTSRMTYQADYSATSKLLFTVFGGYQYSNFKNYGIPPGTRYRFATPNTNLGPDLPVPANLQGPIADFTPNNQQTVQDIFTRVNLNAQGSYLGNFHGQHSVKFGYALNRLTNKPVASTWPDGYVLLYWNSSYNAITKSGRFRGTYGYYINRVFATEGDVASNNTGLFLQDNWRVNKHLTLNLGVRSEREFVPSYRTDSGIASKAITFGFGSKVAPRLGFTYDPKGDGKQVIRFAFALYYDVMKYELPRGSFGGDKWKDYYYTLENPNFFGIKPNPAPNSATGTLPGTLIEVLDRRIPSNDPSNPLVDPNLMPVRSRTFDVGYERNFAANWVLGARYTRRQLDRTIEDTGILTPLGEQYYITNPGYGFSIDPSKFPSDYPKAVTPKAQRTYDALELRVEKRFARNYFLNASYTYSRLYGNYGGLASSDENGRNSPNVNRYFDEAWMSYDANGKLVYGRLGTDRPHTFKLFGSYALKSKMGSTTISPQFFAFSGTPITTEVMVDDVPMFVKGRGDLGRTPIFSQMDFLVFHDFTFAKLGEGRKFRFEVNIRNLFNQDTATNIYPGLTHANDGSITFDNTGDIFKGFDYQKLLKTQEIRNDPRYNQASAFQNPREVRFGFHFFF